MPYRIEIVETENNIRFLRNLPKSILPTLKKKLESLGNHPYLGRSVNAPIPAYIYSFDVVQGEVIHKFVVSYKISEGSETIFITSFGREIRRKKQ